MCCGVLTCVLDFLDGVISGTQADLLGVAYGQFGVDVRVQGAELVGAFFVGTGKIAVDDSLLSVDHVEGSLLESYRVAGGENTHVGYEGALAAGIAKAIGDHVEKEGVEKALVLFVFEYGQGVLDYALLQQAGLVAPPYSDGVVGATDGTLAAADAGIGVDCSFAVVEAEGQHRPMPIFLKVAAKPVWLWQWTWAREIRALAW